MNQIYPHIPPGGCLEVRFDLNPYGCPYISSMKDYRAPGNPPAFPFTGIIEHTLWWQVTSPGLPLSITYNLPPGTIMTITDQIGGIFLNIGPFVDQGTATIPGTVHVYFFKGIFENVVQQHRWKSNTRSCFFFSSQLIKLWRGRLWTNRNTSSYGFKYGILR